MFKSPLIFRYQVIRFVILFVERAGSTYLTTLLKSHPDINAVTEKLSALRVEGQGAAEQLAWMREFLMPPLLGSYRAVGFKSKQTDILDPEGFAAILHHHNCRIIQLQRRNSVKAVISTINARRLWESSGNWNLLKEKDRQPPMEVDLEEFDNLLELRKKWDHDLECYVEQLNLPTLPLFYEDLLQNEDHFVQKIFQFLEVDEKPVQGKTIKHTKDDLREVIINFDELRDRYRNTPYEVMFEQVTTPPE